jgi:phosphate-selective porin OprO and OprP
MIKVLLATAVLVAAAGPAVARPDQEPAPSPSPLGSPAPDPSPSPSPSPAPESEPDPVGRVSAGPEGFVIQSETGDFRLQLRGYVQFDGRFYPDTPPPAFDAFLVRRVRPTFQGTVARYFAFTITPDFGAGLATLQDGFIDVRASRKLRARLGKFKPPVGLERLQPATATTFIERALPTGLVPNRDLGIQLSGELGSGALAYAAGIFNGAVDGASIDLDLNSGKELAGRLFLAPFRRTTFLKELKFGVAGTTGDHQGPLGGYRSSGQIIPLFTYEAGVVAAGRRRRVVPQLSYYQGPFGLLGEYVSSQATVRDGDTGPTTRIQLEAWQTTVVVSLTGDDAAYAGVRPRRPFDPAAGHWGALELAARVNGFSADDRAFALGLSNPDVSVRKAFSWGVGLNWHLNRNVKQQVNYDRTTFTGGAPSGGDKRAENALFIRTQLAF